MGVFILSPEFAARNWTMAELMCFQKRDREALESKRPLAVLIPVFYRLDISTCRNETTLFRAKNESGDPSFLVETFFERAAENKITVAQVARAMKQVSLKTGIENFDRITNENAGDMPILRNAFIDKLVDEIDAAVHKTKASGAEDDAIKYCAVENTIEEANAGHSDRVLTARDEQNSFAPYFEVWEV